MTDEPEFRDAAGVVTAESYARWLQAQRPPFDWFHRQSEEVQASLAEQGAIYRIDGYVELGKAIRDPEGFEAEVYADQDPEAAEFLVRRLSAQHVSEILGQSQQNAPQSPRRAVGPSMVGALKRQEEDQEDRIQTDARSRPFLGRLPDAAQQ